MREKEEERSHLERVAQHVDVADVHVDELAAVIVLDELCALAHHPVALSRDLGARIDQVEPAAPVVVARAQRGDAELVFVAAFVLHARLGLRRARDRRAARWLSQLTAISRRFER